MPDALPLGSLPSVFSPLAKALLDGFSEGVVVFDVEGRLLYANQQAREALVGMDLSETRPTSMPRLAALGGRLRPLRVGALELGEAMFIPGIEGPDHVGGPGKRGYRQDTRREQLEARRDGQASGHQPDHPLAPSQGVRATPRRPEQMGANLLVLLLIAAPSSLPHPTPPHPTPAQPSSSSSSAPWPAAGRATRSCATTRRRIRYRLSVGVGRRRWAEVPASAVEEQVADVQWQQPNDLRVDVVGRRFRTRSRTLQLSSVWDRPWFVPRGVDDSVRIFSNDFPATGALHPLAQRGPRRGTATR